MPTERPVTPPRLAVVDDNADFRAIVRAVAETLGWTVGEFEDGRAFISALARGRPPRLVMLDMAMPGMDGIETIGALAATSLRCRIILVTGRVPIYSRTAEELARAHGLEIANLLQKPFPLARLRDALAAAAAPGPPSAARAAES